MQIQVQDMSCQHCVATITKALHALDQQAAVQCNLDDHTVQVTTARSAGQVTAAISNAGYTPVLLPD